MTDIGSRLQQARLQRALTLRQISNATKISLSVLEALERNDLSRLPGGIFVRGYLRAYASQLGLDPEQLVEEFRAESEPSDQDQLQKMHSLLDRESSLDRLRLPLMLLLGLLFAIYIGLTSRSAEMSSTSGEDTTATLRVETETFSAAEAIHDVTSGAPASVGRQGLRLELQPLGPCWVSATADGRRVLYELMQPGDRATLDARNEIQLRVGDAGALAYFINGVPGRQLGQPGEAVSLRITKGNSDALQVTSPLDSEVDGGTPQPEVPL